jgi:hypothetical protein
LANLKPKGKDKKNKIKSRNEDIKMNEKMKQYLEMVKALKNFGNNLLDEYYESESEDNAEFMEEVECMDMHLECCINILEKTL